ncbi:MAG: DUF4949 domain-containing protein [Gammaproteobacteria bacterium]|nr:DUF4949 domain-containing protein [Gammaproteobacteria bacterium]
MHFYKVILLILFVSMKAYALTPPKYCPSVRAIETVGVSVAKQQDNSSAKWIVYNPSSPYDTDSLWTFVMATDKNFDNEAEAIKFAREDMSSLQPFGGVNPDNKNSKFYCIYLSNNFWAVAVSPAKDPQAALSSILSLHFKHK